LTPKIPFDISGVMEKIQALSALAALAQESRLDIYRLLVQAGAVGLPAGQIGERLGLPSATLAFHLKELKNAGLATFTRNGRSLIYAAVYPTMNALLEYLTENCCQGNPAVCGLATANCTHSTVSIGADHEAPTPTRVRR
jgi:DNA-binding transcriptional ArsR family regulator